MLKNGWKRILEILEVSRGGVEEKGAFEKSSGRGGEEGNYGFLDSLLMLFWY